VVVVRGLTVAIELLPGPAGAHVYVYGPPSPPVAVAVSVAELPGQMDIVPVAITAKGGLTVTVTTTGVPVHPLPSEIETVYVVVAIGDTVTEAVAPVPAGNQV
jgi:hypothetical protein